MNITDDTVLIIECDNDESFVISEYLDTVSTKFSNMIITKTDMIVHEIFFFEDSEKQSFIDRFTK